MVMEILTIITEEEELHTIVPSAEEAPQLQEEAAVPYLEEVLIQQVEEDLPYIETQIQTRALEEDLRVRLDETLIVTLGELSIVQTQAEETQDHSTDLPHHQEGGPQQVEVRQEVHQEGHHLEVLEEEDNISDT